MCRTDGFTATPSLGRACLHEMNFRSLLFLYPIERGPNHRHSHNQRSLVVLSKSSIARRRTDISCECSSVVRFSHQTLSDRSHSITFVRAAVSASAKNYATYCID